MDESIRPRQPDLCEPCRVRCLDACATGIPWTPCDACRALIEAALPKPEVYPWLAPVPGLAAHLRADTFAGVPVTEFCEVDRPRVEHVLSTPGMVGVAGLCSACTAKVDAANPVPAPVDHPPPWRWDGGRLLDANGDVVLLADGMRLDGFRGTAALIAAAPRMEALLHRWVAGLGPAPALPTALEAEVRELLAELDAAKGGHHG